MSAPSPPDEAQTLRGVQVSISLDAPSTPADEVVAALLERADTYLHRAMQRTGVALIGAYVTRLMDLGIETGSAWTTFQQESLIDDLLAGLLDQLEEGVRADFKRRLLLDLAATVVPRLSVPTSEERP